MKTRTPLRPRMAYSAADPVSPDVAPKILSSVLRFSRMYSKSAPRYCIAMSLKASVGPLESSKMRILPPSMDRVGVSLEKSSPVRPLL